MGGLRPDPLYQAYIVSRSQTFENSPAKNPTLFIRLPPAMAAAFDDLVEASTRPPPFYRDPDILQIFITVTIALSCLLLTLFVIGLIYFCCCLPLWKWKKQHRREVGLNHVILGKHLISSLQALERAHSNASSALSLQSGNDLEAPVTGVQIPLLRLPADTPDLTEDHDTKGPAGGPRPLGW